MIFLLLLIFFSANFLLIYLLYIYFKKPSLLSDEIKISIIIAAKNEEDNIPQLIKSLSSLDYPKENFEVIIIDDNSNDNTFCKTEKLIQSFPNFSVFKSGGKPFPAKKGALAVGISKAKFPHILITDADCQPGKDWLKCFAGRFSKGCDIVFGPVIFSQNKNLINKISCFERLRNSILTFSLAELNFPYTASGANFGFKKSSFEKINGYSNTLKTFSGDDDLLLHEAIKNKFKIGTINSAGAFVTAFPKSTFKEYFKQKVRHTKTSFYYLPSRQIFLGIWHLLNLTFLFSPLLYFVNPGLIFLFITKLAADFIIVSAYQKKFHYRFNFAEKLYLQIIYELMLIINFLNALFKKDKWK